MIGFQFVIKRAEIGSMRGLAAPKFSLGAQLLQTELSNRFEHGETSGPTGVATGAKEAVPFQYAQVLETVVPGNPTGGLDRATANENRELTEQASLPFIEQI